MRELSKNPNSRKEFAWRITPQCYNNSALMTYVEVGLILKAESLLSEENDRDITTDYINKTKTKTKTIKAFFSFFL